MAETPREGLAEVLPEDLIARRAVPEADRAGRECDTRHAVLDSEESKGLEGVGTELQSRPDLANFLRSLVHPHLEAPPRKGKGGAQPSDPRARDDDWPHLWSQPKPAPGRIAAAGRGFARFPTPHPLWARAWAGCGR